MFTILPNALFYSANTKVINAVMGLWQIGHLGVGNHRQYFYKAIALMRHSMTFGEKTMNTEQLDNFPINESEYLIKTDFKSYFSLMDVPYRASERFHMKIHKRDVKGALMSVRNHITKYNMVCIFKHLANAIERRDGVTVYVRKPPKRGYRKEIDGMAFFEKQQLIKKRSEAFIEGKQPVYTQATARSFISAIRG